MDERPNLLDLPNEVIHKQIVWRLNQDDIWNIGFVCRRLMNISFDICSLINITNTNNRVTIAYSKKRLEIILEKLQCVMNNSSVAQRVKFFTMNQLIHGSMNQWSNEPMNQ